MILPENQNTGDLSNPLLNQGKYRQSICLMSLSQDISIKERNLAQKYMYEITNAMLNQLIKLS